MSEYTLTFAFICRIILLLLKWDFMEYLSIHDMSKKWNIKERKLTTFCRDNRIEGAKKIGKEWMIPSDSIKPLDKRTKEFENFKFEYNESITTIPFSESNSEIRLFHAFEDKYNIKPSYSSFTPYRLCPLGAHVDHNLGKVTGFAIDKGIHIVYDINNNGIVELKSLQFSKKVQWHILNTYLKRLMIGQIL